MQITKINRINTKEELITLLKCYDGILTDSMINYLNSLIELEFSVIRNYIGNKDRIALSELEVYKKISIYNIYHKALNIFKQNKIELKISDNDNGIEGLIVYATSEEKNIKLFVLDYKEGSNFQTIPDGYRTMQIGNISLFQIIESAEQREAELMRVMGILDKLYDEKNPYHSIPQTYGGPASQWDFEHNRKIKEYEEIFRQLDNKKELTDEEKRKIEITKQFHELLLEDYGLTNKSFKEENNQSSVYSCEEENELHKTLIKKMPNLNIKNNIEYI